MIFPLTGIFYFIQKLSTQRAASTDFSKQFRSLCRILIRTGKLKLKKTRLFRVRLTYYNISKLLVLFKIYLKTKSIIFSSSLDFFCLQFLFCNKSISFAKLRGQIINSGFLQLEWCKACFI